MRNDTNVKTINETTRDAASWSTKCFGTMRRSVPAMVLAGSLMAGVAVFGTSGAHAQALSPEMGVDRADVVEQLDSKHSETPIARGLGSNGAVYEVFSTHDGTTWTIIMTLPNGKSYMLGSGEHWANVPVTKIEGPGI